MIQGEGEWVWGVDEVQEADQRPAFRSQPDPQPTIHSLVVTHHQQGQCKAFYLILS